MSIWTLADLHLALSKPEKDMSFFGSGWKDYMTRIERNWKERVGPEDLVLIPGDICWAMNLEEALVDLKWIDALPGTKLISKGNHDYWWASNAKMTEALPPSIHFIYNSAIHWNGISIGGARLWDTQEYDFRCYTEFKENPRENTNKAPQGDREKIFLKELERLKISLRLLDPKAKLRIAMVHYPPIGADLKPSMTSKILEEFNVDICVFGHLHSIRQGSLPFGELNGVRYVFASSDYLEFKPVCIS